MGRGLLRVAVFVTVLGLGLASLHATQWLASSKHKSNRSVQNVYEQRRDQAEASSKR